jgi:hypothetical protein
MLSRHMAASPEVMQANGAPPPPGSGADAAPAAGGMMTPQAPAGEQEGAKADVLMAQKMLERALPKFGSGDKRGKAILKSIASLAREFGKEEGQTEELMPAEIKQLLQGLAGPGAPPKPPPGAQGAPPPGAPPPGAPPPGAM